MSKLLLPALGIGGLSAVGFGGYSLLKGRDNLSQKEETFKSIYAKALLEKGNSLWDSKFNSLKTGEEPAHPILKNAKTKATASTGSNEQEAKELHQQGCQEIYDSNLKNTSYFNDFKTYCAKNLKDEMGSSKKWISEGESDTGKWNNKLKSLSTHDEAKNQILDSYLASLKGTLTGQDSSWGDEKRKSLKDWCDDSQKEIFTGKEDSRFVQADLYCIDK
ncbi:hypothetical protein MHC_03650 [Mycoplasma haemocanis str. Illinois]|uniref:Uncharacterized protein n=1 Tax=Mycoplasma haemocanis (strain Illinois) TaxID=1111676 RepID=H6N7G8_MYCHN|nr:hypothetical protein [Mycoplasma haemocanis]AEW45590.1 hypothetical protein MHC_03650 [Mycoplasma haemocanis str. Illinois]